MREKEEADRVFPLILYVLMLCLLASSLNAGAQEERQDTDMDGMPDDWEEFYGFNVTDPSDAEEDPDSDGLINLDEYRYSVNPLASDSDGDGMPDGWEADNELDPKVYSADEDPDRDGYINIEEYRNGTDPQNRYDSGPVEEDEGGISGSEDASSMVCLMFLFLLVAGAIVFFVVPGIYSKIRKDRLLDHETRKRIMEFVKSNPGTYYSQLRRELDLPHGVLTHHLNMLETQGLVFSKQDRQFRRFYAEGLYKDSPMVTGTQKRVLDEIRRYPGLSQKEISEHLDVYPMMVSYHVGQLENLGLVEKRKKGRRNLLYARSSEDEKSDDNIMGRGPFEGPAPEMAFAEN